MKDGKPTRLLLSLKAWGASSKEDAKAKAKAIPTKMGMLVPKLGGKRVSTINQKKLSIIIANDYYGLSIKDNNIADAINMARAARELKMV